MTLPTYDQLMLPLMKLLAEQKEAIKLSSATKILAERSGLSDNDLNLRLSSGTKTVFYDRVGWAKTYLVKAGLIQQPSRGLCELSSLGWSIDLSNLPNITNQYLMQFEGFSNYKIGANQNKNIQNLTEELNASHQTEHLTPEEIIEQSSNELNQTIKDELLNKIKSNSPKFFE